MNCWIQRFRYWRAKDPGHPAGRCETCLRGPDWTVSRRGDAVVSWACRRHLAALCLRLQRDHEVTELVVTHSPKVREWAEISRSLDRVADDG